MFKFDLLSFILGLIVAWVIAIVLYQQRAGVQAIADRLRARGHQLRTSLTANIESRYLTALRAHLDQLALTHTQAAFDQLYVMQRFAAPVARPTLTTPDPNAPTTVSLSAALRSTTQPGGAG